MYCHPLLRVPWSYAVKNWKFSYCSPILNAESMCWDLGIQFSYCSSMWSVGILVQNFSMFSLSPSFCSFSCPACLQIAMNICGHFCVNILNWNLYEGVLFFMVELQFVAVQITESGDKWQYWLYTFIFTGLMLGIIINFSKEISCDSNEVILQDC